jgi:hypothetical protein
MNKLFSFIVMLIIISSSIFAQDVDKVKAKTEEMNRVYTKAMIDNDVGKMLSMYTDDIISMPSYQPTVKGIAKVKELSEMQAKSGWKTTHFVLSTSISALIIQKEQRGVCRQLSSYIKA